MEKKEKVIIVKRRLTVTRKVCVFCGKTFEGTEKARFCSDSCRRKADYEKHREKRLAQKKEKYRKQKAQKQTGR